MTLNTAVGSGARGRASCTPLNGRGKSLGGGFRRRLGCRRRRAVGWAPGAGQRTLDARHALRQGMQRVLDTLNTGFHAIQTPALCQQAEAPARPSGPRRHQLWRLPRHSRVSPSPTGVAASSQIPAMAIPRETGGCLAMGRDHTDHVPRWRVIGIGVPALAPDPKPADAGGG